MDTSSILHTPALQDKNVKRISELGSFSNKDTTYDRFEIIYVKKPKLNTINQQEEIVETIETAQIFYIDIVVRESTTLTFFEENH